MFIRAYGGIGKPAIDDMVLRMKKKYPKYIIIRERVNGKEIDVLYENDGNVLGIEIYSCAYSFAQVPYDYFLSNDKRVELFSEKELNDYIDKSNKETNTIEIVYYIRMSDGACGQVKYYKGLEENYPPNEYMKFGTEKERDNAASEMQNEYPPIEQELLNLKYSGNDLAHSLKTVLDRKSINGGWEIIYEVFHSLANNMIKK